MARGSSARKEARNRIKGIESKPSSFVSNLESVHFYDSLLLDLPSPLLTALSAQERCFEGKGRHNDHPLFMSLDTD